jgi:Leucine-rich repeat (LRR) protein
LDLGENGIRDDGMMHLNAFKNMQSLTLNYNRLTDLSVDYLKGYKQLKFLNLKGNLISDKKKAELIESMPHTTVNT